VSYFSLQNWLMGPWLILSVCGVLLFRRSRTPALALMVIGFAVALLAGVAQFVSNYGLSRLYQNGSMTAAAVKPYGLALLFALYGRPGGALVGALGLLWHVCGASPNNRWRGP
jgi:hypothetical protein